MIARQIATARLSMPATDGVPNRLSNPRHNATMAARPAGHSIHKTRLLAMIPRSGHTTDNRLNHIGDRLHQPRHHTRAMVARPGHTIDHRLGHVGNRLHQTGQNPRPTSSCHRIRHRLGHVSHRLQQALASARLPTGNRIGHRLGHVSH
jgi:hypothetical protein